jgi:probable HAF family extracellular repeat protein
MKAGRQVIVAIACLCLAIATAAGAQSLTFTTIDFPGAVLTNAQGINAQGEIVGFYTDTAGRTHGFLQSGGQFRSIDFPGAQSTQARGIGPAGDIVGSYQRPGESTDALSILFAHGFLLTRRGGFLKVDYPGHQNTIPQRILPDGTILGCYHDHDTMTTMRGVTMSRRGLDEITAHASMHNGATPDGQTIVGLYTDMMDNRGKAYVIRRGAFSSLEVPGATQTAAWDVNPSGLVVGVYRDGAGAFHGFQYDGQTFGRIDVPGATATRVFGVNAHGDIVGAFVDTSGRTHGFLAQWTRR